MDIKKAVQAAVNFERKGVAFYMELASQTENRLGRRLFYTLAKEEIEHILTIDDINRKLQNNEKPKEIIPTSDAIENQIKQYFQAFKTEELKDKNTNNLDGYEMAMNIENKGYEMYKNFWEEAKNPTEKEFFEKMMKEEKSHFEALQNVYYYLTSRDHWHSEKESQVWNWMV